MSMSIFLQGNSYSFHLTGHAAHLFCDKVGDKTIGNEEDGIFPFLFAALCSRSSVQKHQPNLIPPPATCFVLTRCVGTSLRPAQI